jgi:Glycosyl hydrolase family 30 beta sandwich domain
VLSVFNRVLGTTSIAFLVAHAGLLTAQTQIEAWVTNPDRKTPDGKIVLIVANDTQSESSFAVQHNGQFAEIRLNPGAVGTYIW